jgi:hypothetical protein
MVGEIQPAKAPSTEKAASSKGKVASNKGKSKAVERSGKQPMVVIKEGSVGDGETVELGDEIEFFFSLRLRDGTTIQNHESTPVRHFAHVAALFHLIFLPSAHHLRRQSRRYQRSSRTHFSCAFPD